MVHVRFFGSVVLRIQKFRENQLVGSLSHYLQGDLYNPGVFLGIL